MKTTSHKLTCELLLGVITLISGAGVGLHWVFGCCHPQLLGEIHCALQEVSRGFAENEYAARSIEDDRPTIADNSPGEDCPLCQLLSQFHAPKIRHAQIIPPSDVVGVPIYCSPLLVARAELGLPPARGPPSA